MRNQGPTWPFYLLWCFIHLCIRYVVFLFLFFVVWAFFILVALLRLGYGGKLRAVEAPFLASGCFLMGIFLSPPLISHLTMQNIFNISY